MTSKKYTLYLGQSVSGDLSPSIFVEEDGLVGVKVVGLSGFIEFLELHLGLRSIFEPMPLQLEAYLQALETVKGGSFFEESLKADGYAVAADLYTKRNTLLESGFDLTFDPQAPKRIKDLVKIETHLKLKHSLPDRTLRVLPFLKESTALPLQRLFLLRPFEGFPSLYQKVLTALKEKGVEVFEKEKLNFSPKVFTIKVKNEFEAALAGLELKYRSHHSALYMKGAANILDQYNMANGGASLGAESSSNARPILQLILLTSEFLWAPLDPRRVIEFLNLPLKPLSGRLAGKLAQALAETPGFGGGPWLRAIEEYSKEEEDEDQKNKNLERLKFLFDRARYPKTAAPISEIAELFGYLAKYLRSREKIVESEIVNSICKLLNLMASRCTTLSKLELDKVLENNIPEISFLERKKEVGHIPHFSNSENVTGAIENLIWYPFIDTNGVQELSFWNKEERSYLESLNVRPVPAFEKIKINIQLEKDLLSKIQGSVYLIIPESINGEPTSSHPLINSIQPQNLEFKDLMAGLLDKTGVKLLPTVRGKLTLKNPELLRVRASESYSSLEKLFYYPWLYLLDYQAKLSSHSALSISDDFRLKGNFSHKLFECFFNTHKTPDLMGQDTAKNWFDANFDRLVDENAIIWRQEGSEVTLTKVRNETLRGLTTLCRHLVENNWSVDEMEKEISDKVFGTAFGGSMDMALIRGKERCVLDLKYAGSKYAKIMENNQELQLGLYSKIYGKPSLALTAYYIISTAKLYSKESSAFKNPNNEPLANHFDKYQELWEKMEATHNARRDELSKGEVIIRDRITEGLFEDKDLEGEEYLDLSEIEGSEYHDYQVLLGFKRGGV
jgi:PD-(D/E)XK nuclease superfamily